MTMKRKVQMIIDLAMTIMLPFLMAYNMLGDVEHELIGVAVFILFLLHHTLNYRFMATILQGKYTAVRVLITTTDLLLFLTMLCLMISSVILSRHVFTFLGISTGTSAARIMHLLGSYWGFVLMSIHLGFHIGQIKQLLRKVVHTTKVPKVIDIIKIALTLFVSIFGLYEFIVRKLPEYMFLRTQFVFFDYSESMVRFLTSYVAIMVLFTSAGYILFRLLTERKKGSCSVSKRHDF